MAAARIRNVTRCRNTMGERGVLGIRLQPNHPRDDVGGILLAATKTNICYGPILDDGSIEKQRATSCAVAPLSGTCKLQSAMVCR